MTTAVSNGVLYGSGNIIGYDRVNGTYVINEDQAETVRMIFDLYLEGLGETKICKELCRRQRKDGHGNVSWSVSKISRILRNATYMGYKCYLKSYSNNYLEQKRIKNLDESTYLYVKGDFEPIISEEVFKRCEEIRKSRTTKMIVNKGERTYGKKASQDVWLRKLRCVCGSTFRKNKWRTNQRGDTVYGYQCYNQVNNGSKSFREKNGLDTEGYCDIRMIGDWKLDLMAKRFLKPFGRIEKVLSRKRISYFKSAINPTPIKTEPPFRLFKGNYPVQRREWITWLLCALTVKFPRSNFKVYATKQKSKLLL